MQYNFLTTLCALILSLHGLSQNPVEHTYPPNDGPDRNPMKGWNSGWWDDVEVATVGFQYLKWNEFEPTDGVYDFDYVEEVIGRSGSSGRHLILRLYGDWYGNNFESDACPQWLYDDYGVKRLQAASGKYITDYNDTNYISQAIEAIQALIMEYDNDPRIYTFQIGILGYWGEWHTYNFNDANGNNVYTITDATKNEILNTYKNGVSNAKLMGRQPWEEPLMSGSVGFHNDFFVPNNGHSNEFDESIELHGQWLEGPIGGESPPINDTDVAQYRFDLYETEVGMHMITTGHYSTMKLGSNLRPCENDPSGSQCEGFMSLHKKMGYNFQIESAVFAESFSEGDLLNATINIKNIGVAPMYFDWDVQFALLNESNEPTKVFNVDFDLRTILPEETASTIQLSTTLSGVVQGNYQLAMRLIQPGADIQKEEVWKLEARNTYIELSNELPRIEGAWNNTNVLEGGWSVLGNVAVENSVAETANVLVFHKTNGFRHGSINQGINLITNLGVQSGLWTTNDTQDATIFNETDLADYDLVIWCNTSGNNLLTSAQQDAFEAWVTNGGAFMGIHAATDTYRDGSWPFYNELVGAIIQTGPNHTPNGFNATMDVLERHASVDHLDEGTGWNKNEEYYYWEQNGGQLSSDNNNVLFVRSTGDNSYDAPRPIAWYKTSINVNGETLAVRSFYTALGHNGSDYTNDDNFIDHIDGAIRWALPAVTTTYTNGNWDNGQPNATMHAVVNSAYNTSQGNIEARNLDIGNDAILTVATGTYIEARERLVVDGTLITNHQGTVIQTQPDAQVIKNGTINVSVTTPELEGSDFILMGSPMTNETANQVFADAFRVGIHTTTQFELNEEVSALFDDAVNFSDQNTTTSADWDLTYTGILEPARGYLVRPEGIGATSTSYNYMHSQGTLNTGNIIYATQIGPDGAGNGSPNILSNPYPSAISAIQFMRDNDLGVLYFWEHNTQPDVDIPGLYNANYSMEDVSSINAAGIGNPAASGGVAPTNVLASMQGFGIKAPDADPILFKNTQRIISANNTLRNNTSSDVNVIRLHVNNEAYQRGSYATVAFLDQATREFDAGLDNTRMATSVSLYSLIADQSGSYGIQCRESFSDEIIVPLGFSTMIDQETSYTIALKDLLGDNLIEATPYLIDLQENVTTNLLQEAYSFTATMGKFDTRFWLVFRDEDTLSALSLEEIKIRIYPNPVHSLLQINSTTSPIKSVVVYDLLGRRVLEQTVQNQSNYTLDLSKFKNAIYILTIVTQDDSITKQIIKN